MKRVICWDLWGTLIRSAYTGETYEDYLSRWVPREKIQAVVRQKLMTRGLQHNALIVEPPHFCFDWDYEVSQWDYDWLVEGLFDQLDFRTGVAHVVVNRDGTRSDPTYYIAGTPLLQDECPDLKTVAHLWQAENDAAEWLPNAMELLTHLRAESVTTLILITNTTGKGWDEVDGRLGIKSHFNWCYISAKARAAKPDPYVWQTVQQKYPDADEYWMIGDDPVVDIAVPAAMGWKTILVGEKGVPVTDVLKIIGVK